MKARFIVEVLDSYVAEETFEIAAAGEDLELYFTNRWTRVPSLDN